MTIESVKQSLQISLELYTGGRSKYLYSNLMRMSEYFNLFGFKYNSLSDRKVKQLVDLMKKKYVSYSNQTLQHSRKLSFYRSIKKNYSLLAYLDQTRKKSLRRTLVKLRIGCHILRVEIGRYAKIPLHERICLFIIVLGNERQIDFTLMDKCHDIYISMLNLLYPDLRSCIVIVMQIKLTFVFLVAGTGICKVDRSIIIRKTTELRG